VTSLSKFPGDVVPSGISNYASINADADCEHTLLKKVKLSPDGACTQIVTVNLKLFVSRTFFLIIILTK
jgi:hypothetical protein